MACVNDDGLPSPAVRACRAMAITLTCLRDVVAAEISDSFKVVHKEIPWEEIMSLHPHVLHGYTDSNPEAVWRFVTETLPPVKARLSEILDVEMKS